MIGEIEIHQRESSEDTESFLQENIKTFETDCLFLLKCMLRGERLSAKTVVQKYGKESRRLRELYTSGKCEKEWMHNEKGKRTHVEYFITPPKPPTKHSLQIAYKQKELNFE